LRHRAADLRLQRLLLLSSREALRHGVERRLRESGLRESLLRKLVRLKLLLLLLLKRRLLQARLAEVEVVGALQTAEIERPAIKAGRR